MISWEIKTTPTQRRLLLAIYQHCQMHGVAPTGEELAEQMGLATRSGVHVHLRALEKKGLISLTNRSRSYLPKGLRMVPQFTEDEEGGVLRELTEKAQVES